MSAFMLSFRRALLPAFFAVLLCVLPALADGGARTLPLSLDSGARAVDSCMDWLLDASGSLSVEEAASETMRDQFKALRVVPFGKEAGSLWLRFTLPAKSAEDLRPATLMLDMGPGVPGSPTLYVPRVNPADRSVQWQPQHPRQGAVFVLPEAGTEAQTCYIRLPGVPGPWLSPMLRSPHDAATALERMAHPAVLVALGMIILLCLLRSLGERGQWRIWAALYCGAALVHAWYGAPVTPAGHIEMNQAAAVIAPGLALMLLPHVGRQFLHTAHFSRMIDSQYMLLSLPGMLLILLPLVPTFAWTSRLLPLWPLGTLLFVPTTLGAWLGGLVGARRFLLGCLLPPLGTALGLALPTEMLPPDLLATAPMWGVVLGALIVAGSASVPLPQRNDADALPHMDAGGLNLAPRGQDADEEIMTLGAPLNTPADDGLPRMDAQPRSTAVKASAAASDSLRLHLDSLLHQAAALRQAQLPSGPHRQAEQLEQALRGMQALLTERPAPQEGGKEEVFNLQRLLRDVHGRAQEAAEGKNTALSWYMPPHMGLWYKGNAALISEILDMLVCSAVQATAQGAIQISVRRMPESVNPGHLYFTITDTGAGLPPHDRPALALVRAWETAGAHHGSLSLECGPRGTSVSFSLHLAAVRQDGAAPAAPDAAAVLIVDENPSNRQLLSFMLEDLPCATHEARTPVEAAEQQAAAPAALIIMNGQLDAAGLNAVRALRRTEQEQGAQPAVLLALTDSDSQWQPLRDAGFTHALPKPLTRKALRSTVRQLLPQAAPTGAAAASATPEGTVKEQAIPDLFGASSAASSAAAAAAPTEQPQERAGIPDLFGSSPAQSSLAQSAPERHRTESAMPSLRMDTAPAPADMPAAHADAAALNLHMETASAVSAESNAASFAQAAAHAKSMANPAPRMAETGQDAEDDDVILELAEPVAKAAAHEQPSVAGAVSATGTQNGVPLSTQTAASMTAVAAASMAEQSVKHGAAHATEQTAAQAREQGAATVGTAPLRDHEAEAYVPDDSLSLDPDALRDPAIRLLKPTAADRLSAATAPRGPKLELDAEEPASAFTQKTALLPEPHGDAAPVVLSAPARGAVERASATQDIQHAAPVVSASATRADAASATSAAAPQEPRVISAAEVRRSQAPKQETFSASLPEPAEAQDPVSAALQRVKALLGSRAKQPAPVMPEEEDDELRLDMPAEATSQRTQPAGSAAAAAQASHGSGQAAQSARSAEGMQSSNAQTAQTAPSAPRGQRAAMPAADTARPLSMAQQGTEDFTLSAPVQEKVSQTAHSPQPQMAQPHMAQAAQATEHTPHTGSTTATQKAAVARPAMSQPAAAPSAAPQPVQTRASRYDPFDGLDEPIRQMLLTLDVNIVRARQAFQSGNTKSVSLLAAGIAQEAEKRGLRVLSRMGRCVESAAAAGDREALADLLPELEHAVERNRIAFTSEQ